MISLPRDKESQAQVLTEALKKQAQDISQGLDKVFGAPQPQVVVPVSVEMTSQSVVEVPKKLKDKIKLADQMSETTGRVAQRTNLLTRIYSHLQTRKSVNANAASK